MRTRTIGCAALLLACGGCRYVAEATDHPGGYAGRDASTGPDDASTGPGDASTGPGDASTGPETVDRCGLPFLPDDDCGACAEEVCCEETAACAASDICLGGRRCGIGCDGAEDSLACVNACRLGGHGLHDDEGFLAMLACTSRLCGDRCGQCGASDFYLSRECSACLARTAVGCEAFAACGLESDCARWIMCVGECRDPPCGEECPFSGTKPQTDLLAALPVVSEACAQACGLGGSWGCVGDYSWGAATDPNITLRVHVTDAMSSQPVVGASVALCFPADHTCETPLSDATTGEDGIAELSADIGRWPAGFPGFFRIVGPAGEPDYPPVLGYRSRPMIASGDIETSLLTRSILTMLAGQYSDEPPPEDAPVLATVIHDCQGFPSAGVVLSAGEGTRPAYMSTSGPLPEATSTTTAGLAIFPAVPTGDGDLAIVTLTASLEETGGEVASLPVPVLAGHVTAAHLFPTSLQ